MRPVSFHPPADKDKTKQTACMMSEREREGVMRASGCRRARAIAGVTTKANNNKLHVLPPKVAAQYTTHSYLLCSEDPVPGLLCLRPIPTCLPSRLHLHLDELLAQLQH